MKDTYKFLLGIILLMSVLPMIIASCPEGTTTAYCSPLDNNGYYVCENGWFGSYSTVHYSCPNPTDTCQNGNCVESSPKCPIGTTTPYCSSLDTNGYYKCIDGITYHYTCSHPTDTCQNGNCVALTCPTGTTNFYCSSIDINSRFKCVNGITYSYYCGLDYNCQNGNCVSIDTNPTCPPGTTTPYCSSLDTIGIFHCDSSTGKTIMETCNKNIFGVQFICKDGNCVAPKGGVLPVENNTCKSCDDFSWSYIKKAIGMKETCNPKGWSLEFSWFFLSPPQGTLSCGLSLVKIIITPIIFIFSLLFGLDYLYRFRSLKGKSKKMIRFGLAVLIAGIISYLVYTLFILGLILFVILIAIRMGLKSII